MRGAARILAWLAAIALLPLANASCRPARGASEPGSGAGSSERVSRRILDDKPPLELVEREGDPRPALAFAAAHDFGSAASVATAAILEARLRLKGYDALRARPHALGFTIELLPASPAQAKSFFSDVHAALSSKLSGSDPIRVAVREALDALRARTWLGPGDEAVAACSGELGVAAGAALPDPDTAAGRAKLDAWLSAVLSSTTNAFAAVGPPSLLESAEEGLSSSPAWPLEATFADAWPEKDALLTDFAPDGPRRLSIALRVADPDAAILAAEQLGRPSSALALRLASLPAAFRVERAAASVRPRGACLRVDLGGPRADPGPDASAVAAALLTLDSEMRLALDSSAGRRSPDVTRFLDPREAAALAAWRALSVDARSSGPRRSIAYLTHASEKDRFALAPALAALGRRFERSSVELLQRNEPGQGEFWMMVGSPCGTSSEGAADAGSHALLLRALSREASGTNDVAIEPWLAPDGVGLLAHATRRDASESPDMLARRVGSALGRALLSTTPSGPALASARAGLLDEIGAEPRPGYWLAVDALSPGHPSWLEPRGTFDALSDAGNSALEVKRRALLTGPLRVAVLSNATTRQATLARDAFERWVRSERTELVACTPASRTPPRLGELTLSTSAGSDPEGAYVAVSLPGLSAQARREAEATLWLLNRRGGYLEQALSGLAARAEARLLGGPGGAGLVIRVSAGGGSESAAVAQVRGLLDRLARGAVAAEDVALAERELSRIELESQLDPRRRVVDLWRQTKASTPLDLASLRAFQARLGAPHHSVVYVRSP